MPSFHDFTRFISFSKSVVCAVHETIDQDDLSEIKTLIENMKNAAGNENEESYSLRKRIVKNVERHMEGDSRESKKRNKAIDNLDKAVLNLEKAGHMNSFYYFEILSIAAIDAVLDTRTWQTAFRHCVVSEKSCLEGKARRKLSLIFLVNASFEKYFKHLQTDIMEENYLAMYGYYTCSEKITVDGILRGALSIKEASTEQKIQFEKFAVSALWCNIKACKSYQNEPVSFETVKMYLNECTKSGYLIRDDDISFAMKELEEEYGHIKSSLENLKSVGGQFYVSNMKVRMYISWVYILIVISSAFTCSYLNLNRRSEIFDRLKDFVEIIGFFFLTVFGLIKLTTEDPNALKNLLIGRKFVKTLKEVSKYIGPSHESLQKYVSVSRERHFWLSRHGCCYGRNVIDNSGVIGGEAHVSTLKSCGFFLLEGICIVPFRQRRVVENSYSKVAQLVYGNSPKLKNRPMYTSIA